MVPDDDVAWLQGRRELGLDIDFEDAAVHGLIDDEGRGQPIRAQAGDEGLRLPMAEWRLGSQTVALQTAATQPRHLRGGASLIDEDQPIRLKPHPRLSVFFSVFFPVFARAARISGGSCSLASSVF